jgi:hypothetical protein
MTLPAEGPRHLTDRVLRQSLKHPTNLREFLGHAVPDLAPGFVAENVKLVDRDFPRDDWRNREADLPFEVPYRVGGQEQTALVCVLIEHQSDTDPLIPMRMLYFATGYWDRQWQTWAQLPRPRPPLRLSPVLTLVLYTGDRPWGSNRTLIDLLGEPRVFHRFAPVWEPVFWNLADQTPEPLLDSGDGWLQMMAVLRVEHEEADRFRAFFIEALRRLEPVQERDDPRWNELMRIVWTWGQWRRPRAERADLQAAAATTQTNAERQRRVIVMGQTIAESLIEEGQLLDARTLLRLLLEDRFGALPESLVERINVTADLERLRNASRQVYRIGKLDELPL